MTSRMYYASELISESVYQKNPSKVYHDSVQPEDKRPHYIRRRIFAHIHPHLDSQSRETHYGQCCDIPCGALPYQHCSKQRIHYWDHPCPNRIIVWSALDLIIVEFATSVAPIGKSGKGAVTEVGSKSQRKILFKKADHLGRSRLFISVGSWFMRFS